MSVAEPKLKLRSEVFRSLFLQLVTKQLLCGALNYLVLRSL